MKQLTFQQKVDDYECLRAEAHKIVDSLSRKQLRRMIANFTRHTAAADKAKEGNCNGSFGS